MPVPHLTESDFAPSSNVAALRESATIAVSQRASELRAAGQHVIDLGAGQPDFPTPAFISAAAAEAVSAGATRYTATAGILPLREAIAASANRLAGEGRFTPRNVVVSSGSKHSLFNVCFSLFGPGDEVLVPSPGWTSYIEIVQLARATPVLVQGDARHSLKVDPIALRTAATPATRGLILNSPSNPTGALYTASEMTAILELAAERGWWVISDEIYRRITYEEPATSALEIATPDMRLVVVDGVAKAYAMTGWRIGWTIADEALTRTMTALQSHMTYNAAAVSQHAALAALARKEEADAAIATMVGAFRERRDAALEILREAALPVVPPAGAFYLYVNVHDWAPEDADPGALFARRLLDDYQVAVVPGTAFGTPSWIRLSYAAPLDEVVEGARRIVALAQSPAGS